MEYELQWVRFASMLLHSVQFYNDLKLRELSIKNYLHSITNNPAQNNLDFERYSVRQLLLHFSALELKTRNTILP